VVESQRLAFKYRTVATMADT